MGFWRNVEDRRNYLGITRKELAEAAGIKYAVIGAGLERDSVPAANTALKIAKALHIPLENLLDENFSENVDSNVISSQIKRDAIINKYWNVFEDFEKLSSDSRFIIIEMIHQMALKGK